MLLEEPTRIIKIPLATIAVEANRIATNLHISISKPLGSEKTNKKIHSFELGIIMDTVGRITIVSQTNSRKDKIS